jgi:serine/threonine protein kinase
MLVGIYPFDDPRKPNNMHSIMRNIQFARYAWPRNLSISSACKDLVKRMLMPDAAQRIKMEELVQHKWFVKNLPDELRVRRPCLHRCVTTISSFLSAPQSFAPTSSQDLYVSAACEVHGCLDTAKMYLHSHRWAIESATSATLACK